MSARVFIFIMAIVLFILFAIAAFGYLTGAWDEAQGQQIQEPLLYQNIPVDAALLGLDKKALDEAYHDQLKKLFSIWLTTQAQSPGAIEGITNGLRIARRSYNIAAQQISKREQQILEEDRQRQQR